MEFQTILNALIRSRMQLDSSREWEFRLRRRRQYWAFRSRLLQMYTLTQIALGETEGFLDASNEMLDLANLEIEGLQKRIDVLEEKNGQTEREESES